MENNPFFNLDQLATEFNIQPYNHEPIVFQEFLVLSLVLLLLITVVKIIRNRKVTDYLFSIFSSEQESFSYYIVGNSDKLLQQLGVLLFSVQLAFATMLFFPLQMVLALPIADWQLFLLSVVSIFILFNVKFMLFKTIEKLIPWQIDSEYYLFNYRFILFFVALSFFLLLSVQHFHPKPIFNLLVLLIMILFYTWVFFRWLFVSMRYKVVSSIYFFLYLCTLEIAPLLILYKFVAA